MITNDPSKIEAGKSDEYLDIDNMYSTIPAKVRLHMQRVCGYCGIIARILYKTDKYDNSYIEYVCQNANDIFKYHDIGYCFIPINTICKDKETNIFDMKSFFSYDFSNDKRVAAHIELGAQAFDMPIFNRFNKETYNLAKEVAIGHHERWDGTGFPYGKKGEEIPLVARICAVADMYDMLLEFNPYCIGEDNSRGLGALKEVAGTYIDPYIVECIEQNNEMLMYFDIECGNVIRN